MCDSPAYDPVGVAGHLFIVDGDLNRISCDAVLVPTDQWLGVTTLWDSTVEPGSRDRLADVVDSPWRVVQDPGLAGRGPQVWFGNVGSIADEPEPYVDVAEEYVRLAARSLRPDRPIPRVALNVVGSGAGGMGHDKGKLIELLVQRLSAVADTEHADVVLVTWGLKQYSAAQRARHRHDAADASRRTLHSAAEGQAPRAAVLPRSFPDQDHLLHRNGTANRPVDRVRQDPASGAR